MSNNDYQIGFTQGYYTAMTELQEKRKKGKWIDKPVYIQTWDGKTWDGCTYCSECREMHEYGYRSSFCPGCGAEMVKGEADGHN